MIVLEARDHCLQHIPYHEGGIGDCSLFWDDDRQPPDGESDDVRQPAQNAVDSMGMKLMRAMAVMLALMGLFGLAARSQGQTAAPAQSTVPPFTVAQLEQMLAPIALYPDPLLAQILMAATYPLEVVEADRWLQVPANAALQGDQLAAALQQQTWDPSVKSLVVSPQILHMMDSNLDWTENLGDAFLAQQAAVMNAVQDLRQKAQASGALVSTPQQAVATSDGAVTVEPANPEIVYIPTYDPTLVYGFWPWPDYPPFYLWAEPWPQFGIGFVVAIPIIVPLWGWCHWEWHRHRIDVDPGRFNAINSHRAPIVSNVWQHDPVNRRGVPYRDAATRTRFQGAQSAAPHPFRGYDAAVPAPTAIQAPRAATHAPVEVESPQAIPRQVAPATATRAPPPVFESFGQGADVRAQSARGAASRLAPTRSFSPGAGGGHGGGTFKLH